MRRTVFVILASLLLMTFAFALNGSIPSVKADPSVHQGDLVLADNNVTTIEGTFNINGSIIVTENATLILKNALLNFTMASHNQFNMTFENPLNGNPRLIVENATIATNNYNLAIYFYGNSTATANKLTTTYYQTNVYMFETSRALISNSAVDYICGQQSAVVNASDSSFRSAAGWDSSTAFISNCTLDMIFAGGRMNYTAKNCTVQGIVKISSSHLNCTIDGLEPELFSYWNFKLNCTVAGINIPNLTLENTEVADWGFELYGTSNATISNSELGMINSYDSSSWHLYNTTTTWHYSYVYDQSKVWLINSTSNLYRIYNQAEIYVLWYLNVHVVDSLNQDVPSATVNITYPDATTSESQLTGSNGKARFILQEKTMNATGDYPVENYTVNAAYLTYSNGTTVNMTENKEITLRLEGFVIPEFSPFLILPLFITATLVVTILCKRKTRQGTLLNKGKNVNFLSFSCLSSFFFSDRK